jgi:hypothetical protein
MTDSRVELKVCEGCGVLWFRAAMSALSAGVYCAGCRRTLAEFPAPKGRKAVSRLRRMVPARAAGVRQRPGSGHSRLTAGGAR